MHRSGTSMLSRILESLGLFVGYEKESNNEAIFFQNINIDILTSAYANWERPRFLHEKIDDEEFRGKWIKRIMEVFDSEDVKTFLGEELAKKYTTLMNIDQPWGWKDPRNTYTLPLWLEIFPEAKIIHIYRHGIDVASSLLVRHGKREKQGRKRMKRILGLPFRTIRYIARNKKLPTKESRRAFYYKNIQTRRESSLEDSFTLWEEYVVESLKHVENNKDKSISLRYEDVLENPVPNIKELAKFCGLDVSENKIKELTKSLDKSRMYAFRNKPELVDFEKQVKERLSKLGY
jgi:hypothetical protein